MGLGWRPQWAVMMLGVAVLAAQAAARPDIGEVEPNDSKSAAMVLPLLPGDAITGISTAPASSPVVSVVTIVCAVTGSVAAANPPASEVITNSRRVS